jgi:hypothetical protein
MPIHDWTRVPPGIYHDFHGSWIYAMRGALNTGLLPKGYYALAEQVTRTIGPDVLTLERPTASPGVNGHQTSPPPVGGTVMTATASPPHARFAIAETPKPRTKTQRRLSVRHISDHRMVAIIELVSPSNKASRHNLTTFVGKAVGVLEEKIHLLVIDPFPPGKRDPNGVHAAIWKEAVGKPFALPPEKPLTVVSYSAGKKLRAYVEPIAVGDPVPTMPLFLDPDRYVNVPLESTYQVAWGPFPDEWKSVLTSQQP